MSERYVRQESVKIDFVLKGELAQSMEDLIRRGLFSSKPEVVRAALRMLFNNIEETDLNRQRLHMISR